MCFTEEGSALRGVAIAGLEQLEGELARRIGRERMAVLHEALDADWGPSPVFVSEKED